LTTALPVVDRHGRLPASLRVSVTDRCNLRCVYCMPEEEYRWLERADLLSYEEIRQLISAFQRVGVERVRLTGGEPLLRRDLEVLVRLLVSRPAVRDLALTTNGVLLGERAAGLREAGLHRVTVSLDTLRPDRFRQMSRRSDLDRVLEGLREAGRAGFRRVKINTVVLRGLNDDELGDLIELGREVGAEVRFIEYMDVGGATRWSLDQVMTRPEILARLADRYGAAEPVAEPPGRPAERFRLPDGLTFGIISSTSAPFCASCNRSRLTADGMWYLCLYAGNGIDLRGAVRSGLTVEELVGRLAACWGAREDRGAEERLLQAGREALLPAATLREDPHLEMHTRGG